MYTEVFQAFLLDCLTLEDGTDRLSRNFVKKCFSKLRKIPEERRSHLHRGGSLKSRACACA